MASASPYSELDDEAWWGLLARGAIWQSCALCLVELHESASPDIEAAVAELHRCARRAASQAKNDQGALESTVKDWRSLLAAGIGEQSTSKEDRLLLRDLDGLVQGAVATDPFKAILGSLETKAADVYGEGWRHPEFSLAELASRLSRGVADPYDSITATTEPGDPPLVELWVHSNGLGPAAYAVIPYLFVHELICHVPARQQGEVNNGSVFAEGLMDYVALQFFGDWIGEINEGLAPAAEMYSRELTSMLSSPVKSEGAARRRGHSAALRVIAWLIGGNGRGRPEAVSDVARLAVELNSTEALLARKDGLVVRLNERSWSVGFERALLAVIERRLPASALL